jgi:hypothetical protein
MGKGPPVLVADHEIARRLAVIERLSSEFAPEAPPPGVELRRHARSLRPRIVLLFVHPLSPAEAYETCRWLKTDARPIERVGIVNVGGPPRQASAVLGVDLADGYFEGPMDLEALIDFTRGLDAGRKPVHVASHPEGLLNRLLRRFL